MFQIDDEPIVEVDTLATNSFSQLLSIALALRASKQKQEAEPANQLFANIILLTTGFKEAITILTHAYCTS